MGSSFPPCIASGTCAPWLSLAVFHGPFTRALLFHTILEKKTAEETEHGSTHGHVVLVEFCDCLGSNKKIVNILSF